MRRPIAIALASLLALAASLGGCADQPFYEATTAEVAGAPGSLIRDDAIVASPGGAGAWRVLYRSTGLHGEPIAVSGAVIVPEGPAPAGGRPIVAWAHPTSGVEPQCAPSLALLEFQQIEGLREMLDRGYIVVATDYPGLGTPQPHPYLVGVSEGRAVLDSVRAARALLGAGASARFAAWGHSQGGHAALYTGLLVRRYAPELELVGVAAAAPATELGTLLRDDLPTSGGKNLTAMTLWSWQRVFDAPMDRVVRPDAIATVDALAATCLESPIDLLERAGPSDALDHSFLSVTDLTSLEPWSRLIAENTPGPLPAEIPVFIAQGDADQLVRPQVTRDYVDALCRHGSKVELDMVAGGTHGFIARDAAATAVAWMADRFAGKPAPSTCAP